MTFVLDTSGLNCVKGAVDFAQSGSMVTSNK